MAAIAKLFDENVHDKSNEKVDFNQDHYKGKVIGLYFSAHWCPPCRHFTPILIEFYKKYHEEKNLEIIFISSDEDEESFEKYYKDMPWLALDHQAQNKKEELDQKFDINGIPTLILLDADKGNIICKDARKFIQNQDKTGEDFPWKQEKDDEEEEEEEDE